MYWIPNFDAELHNFIKIQDELKSELNIATFLPSQAVFDARQKSELNKFGDKYGVKVPESHMINQVSEIRKLEETMDYPFVIKGRYYDAYIASTYEQATSYFYKAVAKWGYPVIVQEFVAGTEVNVTAIGDGKGSCIGAVPMRKLHYGQGKAWSGISLEDDELMDISRRVMKTANGVVGASWSLSKPKMMNTTSSNEPASRPGSTSPMGAGKITPRRS